MESRKRHIFIVDDFADNRELYALFLCASGFDVTQASDAEEALEKAVALQPDLIVMDLSLPGMDGWEATRQLRAGKETHHIPVLILTAYDLVGALPEGCEGFLTKPCLPDRMIAEITRILDRQARSGSARPAASVRGAEMA
jgi:two-component system, cell cycle response regulator DivK